jgi:hypothetical protein
MSRVQTAMITRQVEKKTKETATIPQFYCEPDFYAMADTLRAQFENQVLGARERSGGMTPFSFAFCENAYQFLTASAERVLAAETLTDLIERVRSWAGPVLGVARVSTPQMRVFVSGCQRHLLRDDIASPWRYSLSLTRTSRPPKIGRMTVVTEDAHERPGEHTRVDTIFSSNMEFNQLLVHKTKSPYSIEVKAKSMNPVEGAVLLDGYLW